MLKNREEFGKLVGLLGWGIGWGISWGLILVYQESVDIRGFFYLSSGELVGGFQSPSYSVWTLNILIMFALGWLIAGLSTGGMLRISCPNIKPKHFMSIVLLWGILGLILGLILSQLFLGSLFMFESTFFLYIGCFIIFLMPAGYGLAGYLGWPHMKRLLDKNTSNPDNQYSEKSKKTLVRGLVIGGLTLSVLIAMSFNGFIAGFVGGIIAGSFGNVAISKYFSLSQNSVVGTKRVKSTD